MKIALATTAIGAALALAACNPNTGNSSPTPTGPGQSEAVNTVQDAAAGPVGQASAATLGSVNTGAFVENAARSDMYEIQAGRLAQERSQNARIREMGQMLVTDHTRSTEALQAAIRTGNANVTPPTTLDERRQGLIDNLRSASAADFDRVWVDQQTAAHSEALTLLNGFAERGDNAALQEHARATAPVVQRHLDAVRALDATDADNAPANAASGQSSSGMSH